MSASDEIVAAAPAKATVSHAHTRSVHVSPQLTSPADAPPSISPASTDLSHKLVHPEMRCVRRSSAHDNRGNAAP